MVMLLDFVSHRSFDSHRNALFDLIFDFLLDWNFKIAIDRKSIRLADFNVYWIRLGIWNLS